MGGEGAVRARATAVGAREAVPLPSHAGCIRVVVPVLGAARACRAAATPRAGLDPEERSVRAAGALLVAGRGRLAGNGERRAGRHGRRVAH